MRATIDQWSLLAGLRFGLASIVAINHLAEYADLGVMGFMPQFGAFEAILGFLLISGYSVSVSYLKEPERFLLRRFQRVYPTYLVSIIITAGVGIWVVHAGVPPWWVLGLNMLFLNQAVTSDSFVGPAWSLSLEIWLYCLAPVLMVAQPRWNRALVYVSFASYLLYTAGRTLWHLPYYSGAGYGLNLLLLSFIWICGLRLAREEENRKSILRDIGLIFAGHILFAAGIQLMAEAKHHAIGQFFAVDLYRLAMQSLTLGVVYWIFFHRVAGTGGGHQRSSLLRFLGDISYPLYLTHIPVYIALGKTPLRNAGAYYLVALAVASGIYWMVDGYSKKRHLQLRDKPRPSLPAPAPAECSLSQG